ncbi:hypothetical protein [Companilactobacillus kedongensis]|uniref:hypothetical protein n=1 Tax=Companilactobacillus kedongensis TaxID=2486004 RepID=UPI000F779F21|nr:hypothetical protein [Companilactobacillus kedongensis]
MIRNAAIQVGNLIKDMKIGFDDSNLFVLKKIPEELLQNKSFPIIRIDGLQTSQFQYVSNTKRFELVGCQINVWAKTNKEIDKFHNLIEKNLSTHLFECFLDSQDSDEDYDIQRLILRVRKNQDLKEII